jgi:hypothetical protein
MATDQSDQDRAKRSFLPTLAHSLAQAALENHGSLCRQAWLIEQQGVLCIYALRSAAMHRLDVETEMAELRHRATREGFPVLTYMTYPRFSSRPGCLALLIEARQGRMPRVVEIMTKVARQATAIRRPQGGSLWEWLRLSERRMEVSKSIKNLIKMSHCLELLPDQHIYLRASCDSAMAGRFRDAFLDVWRRIPGDDREGILGYWKAGSTISLGLSPVIEIMWDSTCCVALTDRAGHRVRFFWGGNSSCGDRIAQQLALVWQHAAAAKRGDQTSAGGYPPDLDREGRFLPDSPQVQVDVPQTMVRWGFDPAALNWSHWMDDFVFCLEEHLDQSDALLEEHAQRGGFAWPEIWG